MKLESWSYVFFQPLVLATLAPKQRTRDLQSAMRRRLDIHGLGITALELLCSVAMSSGEAEVRGHITWWLSQNEQIQYDQYETRLSGGCLLLGH